MTLKPVEVQVTELHYLGWVKIKTKGHRRQTQIDVITHGLRTPSEEIVFTARPKINSHSQIFRYGRSIFGLPHRPKFSNFFDLCLHWVSVVRVSDLAYILGIYFNRILISRWTVRNAEHHDATTLLLHQPNKTTPVLDIWIQYSRRNIIKDS